MARRVALILTIAVAIVFLTIFNAYSPSRPLLSRQPVADRGGSGSIRSELLDGKAIAPKLVNETKKAELGRAAWHVLHTTFARFPEKPTADERESLRTYVHLFQKLYPCGECATHFGKLLAEFPPQVSSRNAAAGWGCFVHNKVNERLGKPQFDCLKIGDFYDCGCGDEDEKKRKAAAGKRDDEVDDGGDEKTSDEERNESFAKPEMDPLRKEEIVTLGRDNVLENDGFGLPDSDEALLDV